MEIEAARPGNSSALSELLAVANKENEMLRELVAEARKRAEMSESALQILSVHIQPNTTKVSKPSFIKRIIVPIGRAIRIPGRKKNQ